MGEIHQLQFVCVKDADVIVYLYLDNWLSTFTSECSLGFFLLETAQNKESNCVAQKKLMTLPSRSNDL